MHDIVINLILEKVFHITQVNQNVFNIFSYVVK